MSRAARARVRTPMLSSTGTVVLENGIVLEVDRLELKDGKLQVYSSCRGPFPARDDGEVGYTLYDEDGKQVWQSSSECEGWRVGSRRDELAFEISISLYRKGRQS